MSLIFADSMGLSFLSITYPEIMHFLFGSVVSVGIGVGDDAGDGVGKGGNVGAGGSVGVITGDVVGVGE